ncbi:hypothetical protein B0H14DRAFT_3778896, partial [Mycena olivaceomarginata]
MVVDHLNAESANENICVACIYLNHKEVDIQTPSKLLSALWRQLVLGREISGPVQKLYEQHSEKRSTPSLNEIHHVLRFEIALFSKVSIVVDAVDEYPENQIYVLLEQLTAMSPTTNFMITSRSHISPDAFLPRLVALEISATEDDVRSYVDAPRNSFGNHQQGRWNVSACQASHRITRD